jgi:hypothetical protein
VPAKTPWCRTVDDEDEYEDEPSILLDLPDDIWKLIFKILRRTVKKERPYKMPIPLNWMICLDHEYANVQWTRQKQAFTLVSKTNVLLDDKKNTICNYSIGRCDYCFRQTMESSICGKCSSMLDKDWETTDFDTWCEYWWVEQNSIEREVDRKTKQKYVKVYVNVSV